MELKVLPEPDDRALPEGKTCSSCHWWKGVCSWLICSLTGEETRCDWAPSRFREKKEGGK